MPPAPPTSVAHPTAIYPCCVAFDAGATTIRAAAHGAPELALALPTLSGPATECLMERAVGASSRKNCSVFEAEGRCAGFTLAHPEQDLESATLDVYRRVLAATAGRHLYRIWNYVPAINAIEDGLENYRRFCRGRSIAFEENFGRVFQRHLPAGSAVGTVTGPLAVAFVAGEAEPAHFENPQQVPAFEYPVAYGPRPPSFSRATFVATPARRQLFISGTAAIRGHATVAAHDLAAQLACTRENLNLIAATAGAGEAFGAKNGWQRTLKIYVRHAADLPGVRRDLEKHLLKSDDHVTYLRADLCRADLLVEIEAVLTR